MKQTRPNWVMQSRAYQKARRMVGEIIQSPERLMRLVDTARSKAFDNTPNKLTEATTSISAAVRLLSAYASGQYRNISFESLALIVASFVYFVMPIDVVPDFIVGLGLVDDIAVLTWTFKSVIDDLERFMAWEQQKEELV